MLPYDTPPPGGGLYLIRLSDTHYYGGRTRSFRQRWKSHYKALKAGRHGNSRMQRTFNKYGRFEPQVLERRKTREERIAAEQAWLDKHHGTPGCVNLNSSANGGPDRTGEKHREETKRKISESLTGRSLSEGHRAAVARALTGKKHSEETKAKIRASCAGINTGPHSEERRRINSESHKGLRHTEETKARMREVHKARWAQMSPEEREKAGIRNLVRGAMKGRKHSEETKAKMRESNRRRREKASANSK